MPFVVREEVASQLDHMQSAGVIRPSSSPWASPVLMVRKKDGTHRFCIDYQQLNAVTKADTYPLPRIDNLLDQLGQCRFFSTLDLASGYWQIRVSLASREKTVFVTPQRLYEFLVMPFGLTNAPAVFQQLMQRLLMGLNPEAGPDFVTVYIDDVLVFSPTLEEHLIHLQAVVWRIEEAGLKLKPSKFNLFARKLSMRQKKTAPFPSCSVLLSVPSRSVPFRFSSHFARFLAVPFRSVPFPPFLPVYTGFI